MHCEAAGAKSLIRSYVDAGHDVLCAENIYAALYYGNDMKNSAIALAQAEEKKYIIWDKKVQKLRSIILLSFMTPIGSCVDILASAKVFDGSTIQ